MQRSNTTISSPLEQKIKKTNKQKCIPPFWEIPVFSSSISLDQEVFKVLILNSLKSAYAYLQLTEYHLHLREGSQMMTLILYAFL